MMPSRAQSNENEPDSNASLCSELGIVCRTLFSNLFISKNTFTGSERRLNVFLVSFQIIKRFAQDIRIFSKVEKHMQLPNSDQNHEG